jgi:hypothetical protein
VPGSLRFLSSALALVLVSVVAGCSVSNDKGSMVKTGPSPATVKGNGRLSSEPGALSIADVKAQPKGSASARVIELLFWAQWGSIPNVMAAYDPRVPPRVGTSSFVSAYEFVRPQLVGARPKIIEESKSTAGTLVTLRLLTTSFPPQRESFLLSHSRGQWLVVFDTLLERALTAWGQHEVDPQARRVSNAAILAGERLSQRYRLAIVP